METRIAEWRAYVGRSPALHDQDIDELEAHLRDQVAELEEAGLTPEEAFLIGVGRLGSVDDLSREFAREHSGRLWKQLVVSDSDNREDDRSWRAMLAVAIACAAVVTMALLVAGYPDATAPWLPRNVGLLVLPFVAGWFAHRRRLTPRGILVLAAPIVVAAVLINVYPWTGDSQTESLAAVHLVIALWFVVGLAYMGGVVGSHEKRMDFVRFTGEWLIYYALIAFGGGVLMGLTAAILEPAGVDSERIIEWILPVGAAGAVIVASWLVESKQQVVENMAPVLTTIFTPLFAIMLTVAAVLYAASGLGAAFDRELLGIFDALMVVVLGLVLYGISARDAAKLPGWMDRIQLIAVISALILDLMVLATMIARIGDLGFTPNRTVALGLNLVLMANLAVTAWRSLQFLTGREPFHRIERWQTTYLPVFAAWAVGVVILLPPVFGFA